MVEPPNNRVRGRREALGWSQVTLAERALLTRQSVGAIEAGRATPAVDVALRIARALGCQVEELFGAADAGPDLEVDLAGEPTTSRLALALVRDRWVGVPLGPEGLRTAADALLVRAHGRRATVSLLRPLAECRDNLTLAGCAVGLGLLADRLQTRHGRASFRWLSSSNEVGLRALADGLTHVAGVHSVSGAVDDANVEAVRSAKASEPLVLVTLGRWEAGLLTRRGDERVRETADVAAPGLRLVAREPGAGARVLLEQRLRATGCPVGFVGSAPLVARGHVDVARAIAMGAADVGVATHDVALTFGLRFVPLAEERYDLVIPRALMNDPRIARLLDVLASHAGRRELEAIGYDVASTGRLVGEVNAA